MRSVLHNPRSESKDGIIIYLFRHGRTISDEEDRFCGWNNEDLTPQGVRDVKQGVKDVISNVKFGKVFSDDLTRTLHTAKMVLPYSQTDKSVTVNTGARTWGIGSALSGKPKTPENEKQKQYYIDHPDVLPKGDDAESINDSRRRWLAFLAYVMAVTLPDMPSVICCHSAAFKVTSDVYDKYVKAHPSGIIKMCVGKDGVSFSTLREGPEPDAGDSPSLARDNEDMPVSGSGAMFQSLGKRNG